MPRHSRNTEYTVGSYDIDHSFFNESVPKCVAQ